MELRYKVITSKKQYKAYCDQLELLVFTVVKTKAVKEEISLLTLLIKKWDGDHNDFDNLDPVALLQSFMKDHQLKAKDLVEILDRSKGYVSDILHYRKGLSKEVIRKLAAHFKVAQEAFNRPYQLIAPATNVLNTQKQDLVA